ncbi:MAG: hypothetical protein A2X13_01030 [Bacteroidetes bacterium GWC2_33_15]|nr:MAG: hypothetical protein A2X10_00125 [Bacteroidetes bacterium GWA2_33_15]OFX49945.1 MAG: hypothetical protein A2X13_01030 [Bacteroidetes bacterium GWC2_33_15]OFX64207.1 MAG: hypothetical protein A2X15_15130 [Bacteroidetes bacterium GWB2_32_14]OFX69619.1 MAG: hypothetical protein A2X14_15430 [Bacteroidetes bacterium GWD2_33_33]HAN19502.1 hypothetical protein [Bacteroidales bacterium]
MKTRNYITALMLGLLINITASASINNIESIHLKLYKAYISNNTALWLTGMNELELSYNKTKNPIILFELARSQYGYIGLLIDRQEFEKAKSILPKAEKNVQDLVKQAPGSADANALLAGIYGFKIMLYPGYVMINGPKGKNYIEKASSIKNITPSVIIELGNYAYHTPSILGGSIENAISYYKKAIKLLELKNQDKNNWQYLNTLIWLAISYDKNGQTEQAISVLQIVLKKEPDLVYVKNELYPKILKNESIGKTYYSMK